MLKLSNLASVTSLCNAVWFTKEATLPNRDQIMADKDQLD